jgi:hypothetical protein
MVTARDNYQYSVLVTFIFFLFVIVLNLSTLNLYLFSHDLVLKEPPDSGLNADEKFAMGYGPLLFASVAEGKRIQGNLGINKSPAAFPDFYI